ncbi:MULTISPECIES: hypothetical protein [Paenibacillus]|uniref:Uncharacterized protein n=1 Tax=Paenibacillus amylolyticus TaxID=1451 RepID=A0AAP5GZ01_PAEAM|nr:MULTISPECIES: hypothetical protein [Paenibacillus]MCG7378236.1 hypothetical protein [Paenibacillus sp. ACRSA]MDR6722892.1 hypothetical protein [Paenibacillus amylolyticus]
MNKKNICIYVLLAFALSITLTVLSHMNGERGESLNGKQATTETSWIHTSIQP